MAYSSDKVYLVEGSTMLFFVESAKALHQLRDAPIVANTLCGELADQLDDKLQKDLSLRYGISNFTPDLALYKAIRKVTFLVLSVSVLLLYFHLERAAIAIVAGVSAFISFAFAKDWLEGVVDSWQCQRGGGLKTKNKHE